MPLRAQGQGPGVTEPSPALLDGARPPARPGPALLWVVRHGESAGNVARDAAEAGRRDRIDLPARDVDVPLSDAGHQQAVALGRHLAGLPEPPSALWVSPYLRARQTAQVALEAAGLDLPTTVDERLREREFGVLDGLTRQGIRSLHPEEAERRAAIGKFYHRPAGGESWTDVLLRLRGALTDLAVAAHGERVLLVAHQVVVLLVRYVLDGLTEEQIMAIDREGDVANCGVTTYAWQDGRPVLRAWNEVGHLQVADADVTAEPDVARAAR